MKIDPGLVVVVAAALFFYLRLILLQRERARQAGRVPAAAKRKGKGGAAAPAPPRYSILSQNRRNWIIAGVGLAALLAGALLKAGALGGLPVEPYWWILVSLGMVGFSWAFAL